MLQAYPGSDGKTSRAWPSLAFLLTMRDELEREDAKIIEQKRFSVLHKPPVDLQRTHSLFALPLSLSISLAPPFPLPVSFLCLCVCARVCDSPKEYEKKRVEKTKELEVVGKSS